MSDSRFEQFEHYGTNAERLAFTPAPAAGIQPLYTWRETDTGNLYVYDTAWHLIGGSGGATLPTIAQGDLVYGSAANTLSALAKTSSRRSLVNTGTSNNPAWSGAQELILEGSINDAQTKALPTAPQTILTAFGSGFWIQPKSFVFIPNFAAGAYTGMNTTYASVQLETAAGVWIVSPVFNDSGASLSDVSAFFAGSNTVWPLVVPLTFPNGTGGWQAYASPATTVAGVDNQDVRISMDNNGSGNLGGGNAANSLKYRLTYLVGTL